MGNESHVSIGAGYVLGLLRTLLYTVLEQIHKGFEQKTTVNCTTHATLFSVLVQRRTGKTSLDMIHVCCTMTKSFCKCCRTYAKFNKTFSFIFNL